MRNYFILLLAILALNCCSDVDTGKIIRPYTENVFLDHERGEVVYVLGYIYSRQL